MDARIAVRSPSRSRMLPLGWVVAVLEGLLIATLVPALILMRGDDKAVERGVSGVSSVQGTLTRADDFGTRHLAASAVAPSLGYADDFATRHIVQSVAPSLGYADDFATRHIVQSVAPSLGYADDFATRHIGESVVPAWQTQAIEAGFTGRLGASTQSVVPSLGLADDYATRHLSVAPSLGYADDFATRHIGESVSPSWQAQAIEAGFTGRLGASTESVAPSLGMSDDFGTRHLSPAPSSSPTYTSQVASRHQRV